MEKARSRDISPARKMVFPYLAFWVRRKSDEVTGGTEGSGRLLINTVWE